MVTHTTYSYRRSYLNFWSMFLQRFAHACGSSRWSFSLLQTKHQESFGHCLRPALNRTGGPVPGPKRFPDLTCLDFFFFWGHFKTWCTRVPSHLKILLPACLLLLDIWSTCLTSFLMYADACTVAVNLLSLLVAALLSTVINKFSFSFVFTYLFQFALIQTALKASVFMCYCCTHIPLRNLLTKVHSTCLLRFRRIV